MSALTAAHTARPASGPDLAAWVASLTADLTDIAFFDAHTHIGHNDPDGTSCTPDELDTALAPLDARAVVFAMHEPRGTRPQTTPSWPLRMRGWTDHAVLPPRSARRPARRSRARAGRRCAGIKLHPRAERFALDHPKVRAIVALAHERQLPVLIHAGRGIPPLGAHALALATEFPDARLILAHGAITDLAWIWRAVPDHPNVFFDTAWWNPADLMALFALIPPGRILFASDAPYGEPTLNAVLTLRCARAAGLDADQLVAVAGGQLERLLAGEDAQDLGPAPGPEALASNVLLGRVASYLTVALGQAIAGIAPHEPLALARMALDVPADEPEAPACAAIAQLLTAPPFGPRGVGGLIVAATVAQTAGVPLPPVSRGN